MNSPKLTKLIIIILVLQCIAGIVVFIFLISYVTNPSSEFNRNIQASIKEYASGFTPRIEVGPKGDTGEPGTDGRDGQSVKGDKGDKGDAGERGADGLSIIGPQGDKGSQGEQGIPGQQGEAGPRAEFRCNPNTFQDEYKYTGDEDWTSTGGACTPVEEQTNEPE